MTGKDMLLLPDGSVYHVGLKAGDFFPRVIQVGCHGRADRIAALLDRTPEPIIKTSSRLFRTITGYFQGVGVSIVATGMGAPLCDFLMRELTFLHAGAMAIIRCGTCGILDPTVKPGTVMVASHGNVYVYRNYAYFDGCANDQSQDGRKSGAKPYLITKPVPSHKGLTDLLTKHLKEDGVPISSGVNASGETFYSCQGRKDPRYDDENEFIMDELAKQNVCSLEMETHQIAHLAQARKTFCAATGCAIGIVNRLNEALPNISTEELHSTEDKAALACLKAIVELQFPDA
eukprot:GHVQ01012289.1.p2 GENE.GHVQ01012289.1~~GHVQ01012289.1.p2  ORF type:complete len:289 (-),score=24.82 GHVQ01012289.1:4610-5476(-)